MGKLNISRKQGEILFMGSVLSALFVFILLASYFSSKHFFNDSQEYSSLTQFIQVKLAERNIRAINDSIIQAECQLPENYFAAKCQLAKSYIQSLWKDVSQDKKVKNDGSAAFSLSSSEKIPEGARAKINSQLEQLRKEQRELTQRLAVIKKEGKNELVSDGAAAPSS